MCGLEQSYQIGGKSQQHHDTAYYHSHAYYFINQLNAVSVEFRAYLVHQPCQPPPPQQCSAHDAGKTHNHFKRMVGQHKCKLGIHGQEQEYDEWIRERNEKRCPRVVPECALLLAALVHLLSRVGVVCVPAETQQHDATGYLQIETVLVVGDMHPVRWQIQTIGPCSVCAARRVCQRAPSVRWQSLLSSYL